jgi:hypothetical protein
MTQHSDPAYEPEAGHNASESTAMPWRLFARTPVDHSPLDDEAHEGDLNENLPEDDELDEGEPDDDELDEDDPPTNQLGEDELGADGVGRVPGPRLSDASTDQELDDNPDAIADAVGGSSADEPRAAEARSPDAATPADSRSRDATAQPADPSAASPLSATEAATSESLAGKLNNQWHDIQAMFVDDPAGSLRRAAEATESAMIELIAAIRNRRDELRQDDRLPGARDRTEQMRVTLRGYRSLCQSISQLGQSLAGQPDQPAAQRRPAPPTTNPP